MELLRENARLRAALRYTEEWRNYYRSAWLHTNGVDERPGALPRPTGDAPPGVCLCYETPCRCLGHVGKPAAKECDGSRCWSYDTGIHSADCPNRVTDKTTAEHVCGLAGYNGMIDAPCPARNK